MTSNEKTVLDYLKMLEQRKTSIELENFYHPEVEQVEFPNAVTKTTTMRSLNDLKDASEKGSKLLTKEEYEVKHISVLITQLYWNAFGVEH